MDILAIPENFTTQQNLQNLAHVVLGEGSVKEVVYSMFNEVNSILECNNNHFYIFNSDTQNLTLLTPETTCGISKELKIKSRSVQLGDGIVGKSALTNQLQKRNYSSHAEAVVSHDENILSELAVPIIFKKQLLGVIHAQHSAKDFFNNECQKKLLQIIENYPLKIASSMFYQQIEQTIEQSAKIKYQLQNQINKEKLLNQKIREGDQLYRRLLDESADAIIIHLNEKIVYCNEKFSQLIGAPFRASLIGMEAVEILPEVRRETARKLIQETYQQGITDFLHESTLLCFDGRQVTVETMGGPVIYQGKQGAQVVFRDITARKERQMLLRKLSSAVEHSGSMILITNMEQQIEYVNPRFTEIMGYSSSEIIGRSSDIVNKNVNNPSVDLNIMENISLGKNWRGEVCFHTNSGQVFWSLLSISPVKNEENIITNWVYVGEDINAQKETQLQMEKLAFYDHLTGLANRRLFMDRLEQAIKSLKRNEKKLALFFIDLDFFKDINDALGHELGDLVLTTTSDRISQNIRTVDTLGRMGGDEFTLLLEEIEQDVDVREIADKILNSINKPIMSNGKILNVSASIGIAVAPKDGSNSKKLLKKADLAMYSAKEAGRNKYHFYTDDNVK